MGSPLFTVATVSYNSAPWIEQTIESVLGSTFSDFEYLVSDDCSTDGTWETIQKYRDPRLRAWRNEVQLGEYANRNKVLREAAGRFVLYIDGDDILFRDSLQQYAEIVHAFPNAKGIWGVERIDFAVPPYEFSPRELTSLNYLSPYPMCEIGFTDSVFEVEALSKLGGFDERYAVGDFHIRRRFSCHYPVVFVYPGRAFWRQHPAQASKRAETNYRRLVESRRVDEDLLSSEEMLLSGSELEAARLNFRIKWARTLVKRTLRVGAILEFFRLRRALNLPYSDLLLTFRRPKLDYKAGGSAMAPLLNKYHFQNVGRADNVVGSDD